MVQQGKIKGRGARSFPCNLAYVNYGKVIEITKICNSNAIKGALESFAYKGAKAVPNDRGRNIDEGFKPNWIAPPVSDAIA
jgi:hypothetical protein